MSRQLGWCFTSYDVSKPPVFNENVHEYLIYGKETCPTTGRQHLQGYIRYKNRKRFAGVKKELPGAHIEGSRGSPKEASDYCKKDGDFTEFGQLPESTARSNVFADVLDLAKKGDVGTIQDLYPGMYLRYRSNILSSVEFGAKELNNSCGVWICGPPRCGKDASVRKLGNVFFKPLSKWWDGYKNEKYVLISDIEPTHRQWLGYFLKIWCDRYPFNAEFKGGSFMIRPEIVFCTSNFRLDDVFQGEILAALKARFNIYDRFDNTFVPRPVVSVNYSVYDEILQKENIPPPEPVPAASETASKPAVPSTSKDYSSSEEFSPKHKKQCAVSKKSVSK